MARDVSPWHLTGMHRTLSSATARHSQATSDCGLAEIVHGASSEIVVFVYVGPLVTVVT